MMKRVQAKSFSNNANEATKSSLKVLFSEILYINDILLTMTTQKIWKICVKETRLYYIAITENVFVNFMRVSKNGVIDIFTKGEGRKF